jgi:hypothetical protein
MSETSPTRRILHLVIEGFPTDRLAELPSSSATSGITEIFQLTEASASEALEKIFTADTVAVWGKL